MASVAHPAIDTVTERLVHSRDSIGSLDAGSAILTADAAAETGSGRVRVAETGARAHRVFVVALTVSCVSRRFDIYTTINTLDAASDTLQGALCHSRNDVVHP